MTLMDDQARRKRIGSFLSSPRLALSILIILATFIGVVSWLPWNLDRSVKAPSWALAAGLDRPFSSAPFLVAVFLLLANTLACTIERTGRAWTLLKGNIPQRGKVLAVKTERDFTTFLKEQGFRTKSSPPYFRNRFALTRGWLFHVGLVLLILGILVQQAYHDAGSFEIGEGEIVRLSDRGVIFDRNAGLFAASALPPIQLALEQFDPYLHQEGYAPDRASTVVIRTQDSEQRTILDRSEGVSINGVSIYQAIPFGLALNVEIQGLGLRSLHLRQESLRRSAGEFKDPSGGSILFSVDAERDISDPLGTGKLRVYHLREEVKTELTLGRPFAFGGKTARIVSLSHWAGFTYSRSPGVSMVFFGFVLLVAGTAVMLIPAGIAAEEDTTGTMRIYLTQDENNLADDWYRFKNRKT
ncbi:MAG: cytochrome c biogenesis protein ResB [Nitrospirae bacterium]|nr:cytochrome c biogenesis protein ResB [Nitrospirota bacterium]